MKVRVDFVFCRNFIKERLLASAPPRLNGSGWVWIFGQIDNQKDEHMNRRVMLFTPQASESAAVKTFKHLTSL